MTLQDALLQALRDARWDRLQDAWQGGAAPRERPSVDLALCLFRPGQAPLAAHGLCSREGLFASAVPADFGPAQDLAFQADLQDADGRSLAWLPGADWSQLRFEPLHGQGWRFVAPYPASLLKLMVATGLTAWANEHAGDTAPDAALEATWPHDGDSRSLRDWQRDMICLSCNRSTDALVAWSHAHGVLPAALPRLLHRLNLPTLRIERTTPQGGWRNVDGAGVGAIQMTAWDTLRLMWWLHPDLPPCPWTTHPRLPDTRALWQAMAEQQLPGLIRGRRFAHKTGNTDNYSADGGLLDLGEGRLALVAMTSSLGKRYAEGDEGGFPPALVALGEQVASLLEKHP